MGMQFTRVTMRRSWTGQASTKHTKLRPRARGVLPSGGLSPRCRQGWALHATSDDIRRAGMVYVLSCRTLVTRGIYQFELRATTRQVWRWKSGSPGQMLYSSIHLSGCGTITRYTHSHSSGSTTRSNAAHRPCRAGLQVRGPGMKKRKGGIFKLLIFQA